MAIRIRTDDENRELWEPIREAREKVEKWPSWKRNLKVSQFSTGFDAQTSGGSESDTGQSFKPER